MIDFFKQRFINHKKVIENYFFMTLLQLFNMALSFFLYPYLIKHIGVETYGIYLFAMSVASYFDVFIELGFNGPIVKEIAQNTHNRKILSEKVSMVFTGKIAVFIIASIVFCISLFFVPIMNQYFLLYLFCYLTILQNVFFPTWFFQGVENMKYVTLINVIFRTISFVFIILMIKNPSQIILLSIINLIGILGGCFVAMYLLLFKYKITIYWIKIKQVFRYIVVCLPIYGGNIVNAGKPFLINLVIVAFFNMKEVTIMDLPMKITTLILIGLGSITPAFYPKMAKQNSKQGIRKIFLLLFVLGMMSMFFLFVFGEWIISILGNNQLGQSIPLLKILSIRIPTYLLCNVIYTFCFFLNGKNQYIFYGLLLALTSQVGVLLMGLWLFKNNIYMVAYASAICAIVEFLYALFIARKYRLI